MSSQLAFITGATGFIGSQLVTAALLDGYNVRVSVRKPEQINGLRQIFHNDISRIQFIVIPEMSKPTAFDNALKDVEIIFHVASPMPGNGTDLFEDYINPALQGTLSLLESARTVSSVKKVVVMSSILAISPFDITSISGAFIKANTGTRQELDLAKLFPHNKGESGPMYRASKILTHQATMNWLKEQKPAFTLATIHPTYVLGPSLIRKTASDIGGINAWFWKSLQSETPLFPAVIVDVRDVADLCVRASKLDIPNGVELVASGEPTSWKDIAALVKSNYPDLDIKLAGAGPIPFRVDNEVLGMKWRPLQETLGGLIEQQLALEQKTL